jgi:hypothetical protein
MNLAQVIHQRGAAAEQLNDLLPADRVTTGTGVDPTLPYAAISKHSQRPGVIYNDGSAVDTVGVQIEVFHDDYDAAAAIVAQIKAVFDRTDFALAGSDRVINIQRSNDFQEHAADGTWRMAVDLNCSVYLESGA